MFDGTVMMTSQSTISRALPVYNSKRRGAIAPNSMEATLCAEAAREFLEQQQRITDWEAEAGAAILRSMSLLSLNEGDLSGKMGYPVTSTQGIQVTSSFPLEGSSR